MIAKIGMVVVLLAGCALAQDQFPPETIAPPTASSAFLGTWEGQNSGGTWITLKLIESGGKVMGTISRDRNALSADQAKETRDWVLRGRVVNVKTSGRILSFNVENRGGMDTYRMVLGNDGQAEIQRMTVDAGPRAAKSWSLTKTRNE